MTRGEAPGTPVRQGIKQRRLAKAIVQLGLLACGAGAPLAQADPLYVIEQLVVSVNSAPAGAGERIATVRSGDKVEALEHSGDEIHVQLANGKDGWIKASYLSPEEPLQKRLADRTAEVEKLKQDVSRLQAELASAKTAHTAPGTAVSTPPGAGPATRNSAAAAAPGGAAPGAAAGLGTPTQTVAAGASGTLGAPEGGTASGAAGTSALPPGAAGRSDASANSAAPDTSLFQVQSDPPADSPAPADPRPGSPWVWVAGSSSLSLAIGFLLGWRMLDRRIRSKYGGLKIY